MGHRRSVGLIRPGIGGQPNFAGSGKDDAPGRPENSPGAAPGSAVSSGWLVWRFSDVPDLPSGRFAREFLD